LVYSTRLSLRALSRNLKSDQEIANFFANNRENSQLTRLQGLRFITFRKGMAFALGYVLIGAP